jgi:ubiquinone/menaquinone biosynthesis C-methylase UbiE
VENRDLKNITRAKQQWTAYIHNREHNLRFEKNGIVGYAWGDPDESGPEKTKKYRHLGDYYKIKEEYILPHINKDTTVLELGSYGGKWTQYFEKAKHIWCVDLVPEAYELLVEALPSLPTEFYETEGNEFRGVPDGSVDFIFCIDTLHKSSIDIIQDYLVECKRILKQTGKMCIHLPAEEMEACNSLGFTSLTKKQITESLEQSGFKDYVLDYSTINHGVLVLEGYNRS